jgi:hypothetical protein
MASSPVNVLRENAVEEQTRYRAAVSAILLNIQRDFDRTLLQIAEDISVSLGTVSNAANRKADLSPTYLKRLGRAYGPEYIDPFVALVGGRVVPMEARDEDALPSLAASVHRLAVAQSPSSEGGAAITHRELLGMLPELRVAIAAMNALVVRAERLAA